MSAYQRELTKKRRLRFYTGLGGGAGLLEEILIRLDGAISYFSSFKVNRDKKLIYIDIEDHGVFIAAGQSW